MNNNNSILTIAKITVGKGLGNLVLFFGFIFSVATAYRLIKG